MPRYLPFVWEESRESQEKDARSWLSEGERGEYGMSKVL